MKTVRGRLTTALVAVAAISVLVTALVAFGLFARLSRQQAFGELRRDAAVIAREPLDGGEAAAKPRLQVAINLLRAAGDHVARVGPLGAVQAFGDPVAEEIANGLVGERRSTGVELPREGSVRAAGGSYAYVLIPVPGPRGGVRSGVILARPSSLAGDLLGSLWSRLLFAVAVAVLVAAGASALVASRLTKRLRHLSDATASITSGDLSHRVPVEGEDELADLAGRFNVMASSLAEARRREQEFLASVSHELRTPVTAIRGYAEALADGTASTKDDQRQALAVIESESGRLERLVQDVIDLARLGAKEFRLELSVVDLGVTLREAAAAHEPAARDAGVTLQTDAQDGLSVTTDAVRVRQVVSNLVENALRVTPAAGTIRIAGARASGGLLVDVADTGPGIAATDLPHVFERSYLWKAYRGERNVGNGLGLAIVRELTSALGGRIDVASEPGRGTTFRLWLPQR